MKRLPIAFLFLLVLPLFGSAQNVFYGERDLHRPDAAIHFDKDGFPYPDYTIADSSLTAAYGSLFTWFQQHNEAFIAICADYELFPETIDAATIGQLRQAILQRWTAEINSESAGFPAVAFYIHGFRKQFVPGTDTVSVTSVAEFKLLKDNLSTYGKPKAFEVEVYWDGTYGCCFSAKRKKNRELFALYENAAENAVRVGTSLRQVLSGIETPHLQIVTHSLGARVATTALFGCAAGSTTPTPAQPAVSVCLIAPAIDGYETFRKYYERFPQVDPNVPDNYRLQIVYNEEDYVLLKRDPKTGLFGPGTKKYGETTLGCNYRNEATELESWFNHNCPRSTIVLVNKTDLGKRHSLRYYAQDKNLDAVSDFLWQPVL